MNGIYIKSHDDDAIFHMVKDSDKYLRQLVISGNIFIRICDKISKENTYGRELLEYFNAKKVFQSDIEQMQNEINYIQGAFYGIEQDSEFKSE